MNETVAASPSHGLSERAIEAAQQLIGPPKSVGFEGCRSLDLAFPMPYDEAMAPKPLRPKAADPAQELLIAKFAFRACERVEIDGVPDPNSTVLGWIMFPVEPAPGMRLEGVDTYYWLEVLVGKRGDLLQRFASAGIDTDNATMSLKFADLAGQKANQGELKATLDNFEARAETTMLGTPTTLPQQTQGLYTGDDESSLRLHRIESTSRTHYERGVAQISPTFLPVPDALEKAPTFVGATHELDFAIRWDLAAP
jgi:hypothetical protein